MARWPYAVTVDWTFGDVPSRCRSQRALRARFEQRGWPRTHPRPQYDAFADGAAPCFLQVAARIACTNLGKVDVLGITINEVCISVASIQEDPICGWQALQVRLAGRVHGTVMPRTLKTILCTTSIGPPPRRAPSAAGRRCS